MNILFLVIQYLIFSIFFLLNTVGMTESNFQLSDKLLFNNIIYRHRNSIYIIQLLKLNLTA